MRSLFYIVSTLVAVLSGCMEDDIYPVSPVDLFGSRGVFIVNEGNYLYGNSSLTYYDIDTKEVIQDIFSVANGIPLGDVAYSMNIRDGKGYIVVNNSSCIHVVDLNSMKWEKTISNLPSPRHILFVDNETIMVSDLYAREISVIDLKTNQVIKSIVTGGTSLPYYQHSTENLIQIGDLVYTNCWSFDNKILAVSLQTLSVVDSITVGIQPWAMVEDANGKLWVQNDGGYPGNPFGHEKPSLMRVNPLSKQVEVRIDFPLITDRTGQIATNPAGDSLYFFCNHLFKISVNSSDFPTSPLVEREGRNFRALSIDFITGDIYISDAGDYLSEGKVFRYKSNGEILDTLEVGITPSYFCFN